MRRAITEQDLDSLVKNGVLVVSRDMVLTPSAREHAVRKGIRIDYSMDKATAESPASSTELARLIEGLVVQELMNSLSGAKADQSSGASQAAGMPPVAASKVDRNAVNEVLSNIHSGDEPGSRALVTVVGKNVPGVVARVSTAVFECGGDFADMSQVILGDYFSLIFLVNLAGLEAKGTSFRVFKEKLQEEESRLGCVKILVMHEGIFSAMHKV